MSRRPLIALAVVIGLAGAFAVFRQSLVPPGVPGQGLRSLDLAPSLPVLLPNSRPRDLSGRPGKVLIVHFWATWCPPCVDEMPALVAFSRRIAGDPRVELLAVSADTDFGTVEGWLKQNDANDLPIALDPDRKTARLFGTEKYPETYIVDPRGRVASYVQGPLEWGSPELLKRLEALKSSG